jgi:hypothetical protein
MDLFKAIFDASESSSSSSSEEEEEKTDNKAEQKPDKNQSDSAQRTQTEGQKFHRFSLPSQSEKKSRWDSLAEAEATPMDTNVSDNSEDKSVPMDSHSNIEQTSVSETLPSTSAAKMIEERLGFNEVIDVDKGTESDDEGVYGPQPLFSQKISTASEERSVTFKKDKDKHRKKKHKHKDKHKHKKKKDKKDKKVCNHFTILLLLT